MECMETVRLRFVFDDRQILTKSQKLDGLKRSWLLLKPQHETFSDLSSYLVHIFGLDRSCPNGILLSMDGFVLPPFESTSILKDKDIIRVKKKRVKLSDILKLGDGGQSTEEVEIVDKQPLLTGVPLLANEEFEKETDGYQSEEEEDEDGLPLEGTLPVKNSSGGNAASKKRKATKNLRSSERKRRRPMVSEAVGNDGCREDTDSPHNDIGFPGKHRHKKQKVSVVKDNPDMTNSIGKEGKNDDNVDAKSSEKSQLQENGAQRLNAADKPDATKKTPSRSARRKKAKRQWLKEIAKIEKELNEKQPATEDKPTEKTLPKKGLMTLFPDQSSDPEDEVVPVVIRPGHIRFEPLGGKVVQQSPLPVETFKWNGTTSKKKGQKWGRENFSYSRRNDHIDANKRNDHKDVNRRNDHEDVNRRNDHEDVNRRNDHKDVNEGSSEMMEIEKENEVKEKEKEKEEEEEEEEEEAVDDSVDFDKLEPYASSPKEGDIIAYRLLELTSTWTPEISSFRVGKISSFDAESNNVALIQVPKYPIIFEVDGETSSQPPDNSVYKEDGSLEIDFTSLVDVRLVKLGKMDPTKAVTARVNESPVINKDALSGKVSQNGDAQTNGTTPVKEANAWDEISQALSAKKAQLSEEGGWTKDDSRKSSWSYRAMRGSALGPTMAILRARNDI